MSNTRDDVRATDPGNLAEIMDIDRDTGDLWKAREMEAILRHQLIAPAERELHSIHPRLASRFIQTRRALGEDIQSFGELFCHPEPPLELLKLTKEFAKKSRSDPDNPLPDQLPTMLYFMAIALADLRWDERITGLPNEDLREGLHWATTRQWVSHDMKEVLLKAYQKM